MSASSSTTSMRSPVAAGGVTRARPAQAALDLRDDHLDRDWVVSSARHDHVRITLARLDELQVHRLNGRRDIARELRPAAGRVSAMSRRIRRMSRMSASASTNTFTSHRSRTRSSTNSRMPSTTTTSAGGHEHRASAPRVGDEVVHRLVDGSAPRTGRRSCDASSSQSNASG